LAKNATAADPSMAQPYCNAPINADAEPLASGKQSRAPATELANTIPVAATKSRQAKIINGSPPQFAQVLITSIRPAQADSDAPTSIIVSVS
jgi:hypothetical protein